MARKPYQRLTPISALSPEDQELRRIARKLNMKNEDVLKRFIQKQSNLPKSDPLYFDPNTPPARRLAVLNRIHKRAKKQKTPWREIRDKYTTLVDELEKMSPFMFREKYKEQLQAALADARSKGVNSYAYKQMRKLDNELNRRSRLPKGVTVPVGEQGVLF